MELVFVAQWFSDQDRFLVSELDRILFSHGLRPVTGHHLGGGELEEEVKQRIDRCDCLIALATRRERIDDERWTTHPWVLNEYGYAKDKQKDAISIVEEGVDWQGMYRGHAYIPLDRAHPSDALLRLSNTVGVWKEKAGQTWKLQILPEEFAERLELEGSNWECSYRTVEQGNYGNWQPITPVPEPGGVFLYVKGLKERQLVEVKVSSNRGTWKSPATPQAMPITLRELP